MNEKQARAIDIGIRAIAGATSSVTDRYEMEMLLTSRRTLERMLAEGFVPCRECGHLPTPFTTLDRSEGLAVGGWCAVCRYGLHGQAYGRSLDEVREEWNNVRGEGHERI